MQINSDKTNSTTTPFVTRGLIIAILLMLLIYFSGSIWLYCHPDIVPTGDEPHFLIITHSLWHDHDIVVSNNYYNEDWKRYYHHPQLSPRISVTNHKNSIMNFGYPLLLVPAYAVMGYLGTMFWTNIIMVLLLFFIYLIACRLTNKTLSPVISIVLIGLSPPFLSFASQLYPDSTVALYVLIAFYILLFKSEGIAPILAVLPLMFLPFIHVKYFLIAGLIALFYFWKIPSWKFRMGLIVEVISSFFLFLLYNYYVYGFFRYDAPYNGIHSKGPFDFLRILQIHLFDPHYGILFQSPLLWLAPFGLFLILRNQSLRNKLFYGSLFLLPGMVLLGFFCSYPLYIIGLGSAGRQLMPILPLWFILVLVAFDSLQSKMGMIIKYTLMGLSTFFGLFSLVFLEARYDFVTVVSRVFHLPPDSIPTFWRFWDDWGHMTTLPAVHPYAKYLTVSFLVVLVIMNGVLIRRQIKRDEGMRKQDLP